MSWGKFIATAGLFGAYGEIAKVSNKPSFMQIVK